MVPRRILIFSLVYYPRYVAGAEVAIKEITDRISSQEIEFDMVTLLMDSRLPRYEKIGNINIHRIGWGRKSSSSDGILSWIINLNKYFYLIIGTIKALRLNKTRNYDAIWSFMASYNTFSALFFKIIKPKVRFIFTLQDGDPIPYIKRRARPLYPLFKMFFSKADRIQAISNYLAKWARDMGAICPIDVVPNAVNFELFSKRDSKAIEQANLDIGRREGDLFLITTSRLVKKNAVEDIIESLEFLPSYVKLVIIGQGNEKARLHRLVEMKKLESRVIFLGHVPNVDLPKYLHASDIFVRPSVSEGLGNSFLEAMASGIPVIGTPVGGIPDFLRDGETGLFCEVHNPRSIAQKVEKLIKDRESRDYIVRQAKEMVENKYNWEKISREMKDILNSKVQNPNVKLMSKP